jgi:hypothetical protein
MFSFYPLDLFDMIYIVSASVIGASVSTYVFYNSYKNKIEETQEQKCPSSKQRD